MKKWQPRFELENFWINIFWIVKNLKLNFFSVNFVDGELKLKLPIINLANH